MTTPESLKPAAAPPPAPPADADSAPGRLREDLKQLDALLQSGHTIPPETRHLLVRLDRHAEQLAVCVAPPPAPSIEPLQQDPRSPPLTDRDVCFSDPFPDAGLPADFQTLMEDDKFWPAIAAVSTSMVVVAALWLAFIYERPHQTPHTESRARRLPFVAATGAQAASSGSVVDFERGADLIDQALGHFPGQRAEDVLSRVHNDNMAHGINVCAFEWNGGNPSLLFGPEKGHIEIADALDRCAEAIEVAARRVPLR